MAAGALLGFVQCVAELRRRRRDGTLFVKTVHEAVSTRTRADRWMLAASGTLFTLGWVLIVL
jgi:hypothetical protein